MSKQMTRKLQEREVQQEDEELGRWVLKVTEVSEDDRKKSKRRQDEDDLKLQKLKDDDLISSEAVGVIEHQE